VPRFCDSVPVSSLLSPAIQGVLSFLATHYSLDNSFIFTAIRIARGCGGISGVLSRHSPLATRHFSFIFINLRPLWPLQKSQPVCNQSNPASFAKTPGVGVPLHFPLLASAASGDVGISALYLATRHFFFQHWHRQRSNIQTLLCYYRPKFGPNRPQSAKNSPPSTSGRRLMPDGTRRSGRIPKQIAIALIGSDIEGRVFSEQTKTVVLSRHGAGIISAYKLSAEQEVVIRNEESNREIEARIVGQIGSDGDTYIYGIAFLDPQINFWGLDFPDLSETEKQATHTLLECSSCHTREMADHSDLASDVMAVNESIMRYCQKCGLSTLWKKALPGGRSTEDGSPESATARFSSAAERPVGALPSWQRESAFAGPAWMHAEALEPIAPATMLEPIAPSALVDRSAAILPASEPADTPAAAAPSAAGSDARIAVKESGAHVAVKERDNRRKHTRTRVNFKACVRRAGSADDIVACEDMSRGGLRFKSSREYFEKTLIEVAVLYSQGDQAIFVPAQIVYVQELPEQKLYRCGAIYLRSGK
jgi:hypothetical protein